MWGGTENLEYQLLQWLLQLFLCAGSRTYRLPKSEGSTLTRICQVIVASFRKLNLKVPADQSLLYETDNNESIKGSRNLEHTDKLKFFDMVAVKTYVRAETE
ncbi:hypothetical protein HRI_003004700 [Hibiscus trionum]|uniref:Uncharacterized protein n=1 Tax=Hibiscus trionum TaxID=183268 RepID=A0A9W7IC77_HIBTR|nr:hypothetical protein HRI_003004700 [Hibiscus trionum]